MRTAATDLVGVEFPIFAFSHCRDVVAAVSKAGGLGVLGAVAHTPEQLEIDLDWIEEEVGDRPYGVDLIVPAKYGGEESGGYSMEDVRRLIPAEHQQFVDEILARYDVPELPDGSAGTGGTDGSGGVDDASGNGSGRGRSDDEEARSARTVAGGAGTGAAPFSATNAGQQLDIALAHRTVFVANALGPPPHS